MTLYSTGSYLSLGFLARSSSRRFWSASISLIVVQNYENDDDDEANEYSNEPRRFYSFQKRNFLSKSCCKFGYSQYFPVIVQLNSRKMFATRLWQNRQVTGDRWNHTVKCCIQT